MNRIIKFLSIGQVVLIISCSHTDNHKESQNETNKNNKPIERQDKIKNKEILEVEEKLPSKLKGFIPTDYTILDTTRGDLNHDPFIDMIMVLKKTNEDTTSDVVDHPEKRPLLILIGQNDHSFKLVARNDNTVYCIDCGGMMGDPFTGIVIKDGYFSVTHYGGSAWRWSRIITYKYSSSDHYWYLHKDGTESFNVNTPDSIVSTIRTIKDFGKIPFDKFNIYKD